MKEAIKILIVDDEESSLRISEAYLSAAGYEVVTTNDPRQVAGLIKEIKPSLLVTDFVMDALTGVELVQKLRERLVGLPVILMSADLHSGIIRSAAKIGIEYVIRKPLAREEFLAAVQDLLGSRI